MKEGNNGEVKKLKRQKIHSTAVRDINFILSTIILNVNELITAFKGQD